MPNRLGSKKVAVSALIALGAVGGSVAYAYPPNTSMTVAANVSPQASGADIAVTVDHANPGCNITISVDGAPDVVVPAGHGETFTQVITTSFSGGEHKIKVKGTGCSAKEKVSTVYDITNQRIETNASSYRQGKPIKIKAFNFTPNAGITFRLIPPNSSVTEKTPQTGTTNKQGNASASFTTSALDPAGTYTVTVYTSGTVVATQTITLDAA